MSDFGAGIFDQDPHPAGGKEPQPQVPGQEPASGRRPRRRRGPADAAVEMEAKKAAGYFAKTEVKSQDQLKDVKGRKLEE